MSSTQTTQLMYNAAGAAGGAAAALYMQRGVLDPIIIGAAAAGGLATSTVAPPIFRQILPLVGMKYFPMAILAATAIVPAAATGLALYATGTRGFMALLLPAVGAGAGTLAVGLALSGPLKMESRSTVE